MSSNTWPPTKHRTVVLENAAELSYNSFKKEHSRFEQAYNGLEWILARAPQKNGTSIGESGEYWLYSQKKTIEAPEIWAIYTFNSDEVHIHGILLILTNNSDEVYIHGICSP